MSDFGWFGEVFNFSMFNMFLWLYHSLLICEGNSCPILMFEYSNQSLGPALHGASKAPKNGRNVSENCPVGDFWTRFAILGCLRDSLVTKLLQILVEQV